MKTSQLQEIGALAELERIGWRYTAFSESEVRCICPAHNDTSPSCAINIDKNLWKCHTAGCNGQGDIVTFLALALKTTRRVVMEDLGKRYNLTESKTVDVRIVEKAHAEIWTSANLLSELRKRGVSDEAIRLRRLGAKDGRITIPVYNKNEHVVNVRKYLPGAPGKDKVKNTRGYGKVRLYPVDQLQYDTLIITGGEVKAIATAERLNDFGVGCITTTAGEDNWKAEFSEEFRGKTVYVCMDIDAAGLKAANSICARLRAFAKQVYQLNLPLDLDAYPAGDLNDVWGLEKWNPTRFIEFMDKAERWMPAVQSTIDETTNPISVRLGESTKPEVVGRRIETAAVVTELDTTPYIVPRNVNCACDRNQDGCAVCPVYCLEPPSDPENSFVKLTVSPESPGILAMVNAPKHTQRDSIQEALGIPDCSSIQFTPTSYYEVEDARISPQLEIAARGAESMLLPAYVVDGGLDSNESYTLTGRIYPSPKSQQAVMVASKAIPSDDALSRFDPPVEELLELQLFQPVEWTAAAIKEKLNELYDDFSSNVTRIYYRQTLHQIIDLAYHSPMLLKYDGHEVKGWVEVLIAGDSSQGKSETMTRLRDFYGLGEKVDCKNASLAGLLGGLKKSGERWFVSWGLIPTHDKRLVILEELKGASTRLIGSLTDMRSSGLAEIPKIEKRRTHARTRLVALSNPRSEKPVSAYSFGVEVVTELIGSLEDVRRFDAVHIVSADHVDGSKIAELQRRPPKREHRYTGPLCRRCILWGWTRTPSQIEFTPEAADAISLWSAKLCKKFSDRIPIVDSGSQTFKLARLSAALAVRTFSCAASDVNLLVVRACHVDFIGEFLDETYSDPVLGYAEFSEAIRATAELLNPAEVRRKILATPFPQDFIEQILHCPEIELRDFQDWCGWGRDDAAALLSFLVRKHAIVRAKRIYVKTPPFIKLLKSLRGSNALSIAARPDHIEEY